MAKEYKLPEVLNLLLREKKIPKRKLADYMDTSDKCVYDWINYKSCPSMFSLMQIADILDVTLDYLVYGDNS